MSTIPESPSGALPKPEKKSKKDKKEKKEKKEKKRIREDEPEVAEERKHKRSKSTAVNTEISAPPSPDLSAAPIKTEVTSPVEKKKKEKKSKDKKEKKDKKDKHADPEDAAAEKKRRKKAKHADEADAETEDPFAPPPSAQKDKRKRRAKADSPDLSAAADADEMDIDSPFQASSKFRQPPDAPANPQYPFFTQTVSLFLPLYPVGWSEPCTAAATQHLKPMLSRYVPALGGVLLAFRDVAVAENPGRKGAATEAGGGCDVLSVDEFAVGFGWVTAEVDLFIPKRGAWMEGTVNLESEGHIGVVCWGKFNASIESSRLPPEWHWVHLDSDEAMTGNDDAVSTFTADQEHGAVKQIHSTGYWADADDRKIKGRVRFRIKSFDVGVSGDHGYLSLEGSLLSREGEEAAVARDNEEELRRRRGRKGGVLLKQRRQVPEFSLTKFGEVEDEEDKALRKDVWDTTEPEVAQGTEGAEGFAGITNEEE
ncbi:DNA-dependent RNA polymerase I subunit A43 [Plectosphaerella cucumerina]|uniref:DNA-directed RNA polymerase subunit n=1 Tax=Plectosphaerella cucumerina TaxID=40658 RepID=A0A8K0X3G0_9PEZI|nr:DNA-dependent RNA polymerase I subunit A43 [Plectosphaerella cucumerina]